MTRVCPHRVGYPNRCLLRSAYEVIEHPQLHTRLESRIDFCLCQGVLSDIGGFSTVTALQVHISKLTGGNASFMEPYLGSHLLPMIIAARLAASGPSGQPPHHHGLKRPDSNSAHAADGDRSRSRCCCCCIAGICACTAVYAVASVAHPELVPGNLLFANSLSAASSLFTCSGPPLGVLLSDRRRSHRRRRDGR